MGVLESGYSNQFKITLMVLHDSGVCIMCAGVVDYATCVLQGELRVMVLPECVWSQEHLHTHPGSRQW